MLLFVHVRSFEAIAESDASPETTELLGGSPGIVPTAEVPVEAEPELTVIPFVAGSKF